MYAAAAAALAVAVAAPTHQVIVRNGKAFAGKRVFARHRLGGGVHCFTLGLEVGQVFDGAQWLFNCSAQKHISLSITCKAADTKR